MVSERCSCTFFARGYSTRHDLIQLRTENILSVGTDSKCEYTSCKKALCSGAHLPSVSPWSLTVPTTGQLQAPGAARVEAVPCDAP